MASEDDDIQAPADVIALWIGWRRAKDNEATAFRKSLGLCISVNCKNLPVEDSTRCNKHDGINRSAVQRFAERHGDICSKCEKATTAGVDETGLCHTCREEIRLEGTKVGYCNRCKRNKARIYIATKICARCTEKS